MTAVTELTDNSNIVITGPPNGPVLLYSLASVVGVCNTPRPAGRQLEPRRPVMTTCLLQSNYGSTVTLNAIQVFLLWWASVVTYCEDDTSL